ncbi:MAG: sulfatase-like hydrolase/transferase [Candidatus Hydrogenedentes bacterium]|nr:sulfatase-like hydrolase/transferase [Candidatus Hydrogenedentota bacterium]
MHSRSASRNPHPISRRAFLSAAGVGLGTLSLPRGARALDTPLKPPNILLIMTDDQGYGDLSCLGSPHIETPHLDALHAESTRLSNFHVSPTCAPTRAALLTGRYNNRVGVWHTIMGRSILRRGEVTMADYFSDAGYKTGIFGKWHLGDNYPYRPQERGFQECLVHGGGGVGQAPDFWGNDYFDDTYLHNGAPKPFKGYCTDVWFENAARFIEAHRDKPFFCYLPTNAPHSPYRVAPEYSQPFKDKGLSDDQANFHGMVQNIDDNVGRMLKRLNELNLTEKIGVGKAGHPASPPSEPYVRFSRIRLSGRWFHLNDFLASAWS